MKPLNSNQLVVLAVLIFCSVMFFTSCTKDVLPEVKEQPESISDEVPAIIYFGKVEKCMPAIPPNQRYLGWDLYIIQSRANPAMVLEVPNGSSGNNVLIQQNQYNGGSHQIWQVRSLGNGYHRIRPFLDTTRTLDVPNASIFPFVRIQLYTVKQNIMFPDTYNQQWSIDGGGDFFQIANRNSNLKIRAESGNPGAKIQQWGVSAGWKFIPMPFDLNRYIDLGGGIVKFSYAHPTKPGCYIEEFFDINYGN